MGSAISLAPAEEPAAAASPDDQDCDRIAALRLEPASTTNVHETDAPDWTRAAAACAASVKAHPGEMHYVYQFARAQDHLHSYIEAAHNYKIVAEAGFPEALFDVGALYYYGHGVLQSYSTAVEYIEKAAQQGSARALGGLAGMYADGRGVTKDDAKSLDYAEKAVEAGNSFGLKVMADHYFNGAGVPKDYKMAANYLEQAADLGNGQALKFLANMYEGGYLGPPDAAKAGELRLRAQKVDPESKDPIPARLPMLHAAVGAKASFAAPRRRYVTYRYNPVWQAAPGDTRCCPNNMLVCPLGRHFCGH